MFDKKDIGFADVVDAHALGRKFATTYATHDATNAAEFCLIADSYSEQLRLRIAVVEGIKEVKNDNYNFHLLTTTFEQALKYQADLNGIRHEY